MRAWVNAHNLFSFPLCHPVQQGLHSRERIQQPYNFYVQHQQMLSTTKKTRARASSQPRMPSTELERLAPVVVEPPVEGAPAQRMVQTTITKPTSVDHVEAPKPTSVNRVEDSLDKTGAAAMVRDLQLAALSTQAAAAVPTPVSTIQRAVVEQHAEAAPKPTGTEPQPSGSTRAVSSKAPPPIPPMPTVSVISSVPTAGNTAVRAPSLLPPRHPQAPQPTALTGKAVAPAQAPLTDMITISSFELTEMMKAQATTFFEVQEKRMFTMVKELAEVYKRDAQRTGELVADAVYNKAHASVESVNRLMAEFREDFGKVRTAASIMEARLADVFDRAQQPLASLAARVPAVSTVQPMMAADGAVESKAPEREVAPTGRLRSERVQPLSVGFQTPVTGSKSRREDAAEVAAQLVFDEDVLSILSEGSSDDSYVPSGSSSDAGSDGANATRAATVGATSRKKARMRTDSTSTYDDDIGATSDTDVPVPIPLKRKRATAGPEEKPASDRNGDAPAAAAVPSPQEVWLHASAV